MALTDQTVIAEIDLIFSSNTINVRNEVQIKKNGKPFHNIPQDHAYTQDMKAQFVADVPNSQIYITAMGW